MTIQNFSLIPVLVGIVGGAEELKSLQPLFDEFQATFGNATTIKIIQASQQDVSLFDYDNPDLKVRPNVLPWHGEMEASAADIATYLLLNCHFVLLAYTLKDTHSIRVEVERYVAELPASIPAAGSTKFPIFAVPEPCSVLIQTERNSINFKIARRSLDDNDIEPDQDGKNPPYWRPLFEYSERYGFWGGIWETLTKNPPSPFKSSNSLPTLFFTGNKKDLFDKRWLDCLEGIHRLAEFNSEKIITVPDPYQSSRFGYVEVEKIPDAIDPLFRIFSKADKLASDYQKRWQQLRFTTVKNLDPDTKIQKNREEFHRTFFSFFWMAALSVVLLAFSTEFGDCGGGWANPVSTLLYVAIIFWSMRRYYVARLERWEQKHQDYRFIAEVLAIQMSWMQAGIHKFASNHFPSNVKSDVQWVRRAIHTARFICMPVEMKSPDEVAESWITHKEDGQLAYHKNTLQKRRKGVLEALNAKRKKFGILFISLFCVLIALTGIKMYNLAGGSAESLQYSDALQKPVSAPENSITLSSVSHGCDSVCWLEQGHHLVIVLMALMLVLFALYGEAIEGYALEQELTRSEELVAVYKRCMKEFKRESITDDEKRDLLAEVGQFAIDAEAYWLITHRERPIQPVKGG